MLDSYLESTVETFSLMLLFPFLSSEKLRKGLFYANMYSENMGEIRAELLAHLLPAVPCLPALRETDETYYFNIMPCSQFESRNYLKSDSLSL